MEQQFINLIEQLVTECQYRLESVKNYDACDIEFELPYSQDSHEFFTLLEEKFAENNLVYKIDAAQQYSTSIYYYLLVKRTHLAQELTEAQIDYSSTRFNQLPLVEYTVENDALIIPADERDEWEY